MQFGYFHFSREDVLGFISLETVCFPELPYDFFFFIFLLINRELHEELLGKREKETTRKKNCMYEDYKTNLASVIRAIATAATSSLLCEGLI